MNGPTTAKELLQRSLLESYHEEHEMLADVWRVLEGKAQSTVTIAGIFIAAAFAFIREIKPTTQQHEKFFLALALLFLIFSVGTSVFALWVRTVTAPPLGENVSHLVADLLRVEDSAELSERLPLFLNDQIAAWKRANDDHRGATTAKARRVWWAQIFLLGAILTLALLTFVAIFYTASKP